MSAPKAGQVAVITGAGSGVGRATALALAEDGYDIALIGRQAERLTPVQQEIEQRGAAALVAPADVGDESEVETAFGRIGARFGRVDVLVAAAGIGVYGAVESYSLAQWERTLRTNLTGVFLTTRAALPLMKPHGGAMIAIGSGAGKRGYATLAAYSASKFGLLGYMESLAAEVGEIGIKVSTILPGSIMTGFAGKPIAEREVERAGGRKFLEPADVAQAIRFLLAQPAGAWTQELNLWPF